MTKQEYIDASDITPAESCYLNKNGYNELPDELKPALRALARLITTNNAAIGQVPGFDDRAKALIDRLGAPAAV